METLRHAPPTDRLLESPLVPHAQTVTILRQVDELRAQVGVRYAGD